MNPETGELYVGAEIDDLPEEQRAKLEMLTKAEYFDLKDRRAEERADWLQRRRLLEQQQQASLRNRSR